MSFDIYVDERRQEYTNEFAKLVAWSSTDPGIRFMGAVMYLALPTVNSVEEGCRMTSEDCETAYHEGFTKDVGVPLLLKLCATAHHAREYGAPVPSVEARIALEKGYLGSSSSALSNVLRKSD